MLVNMDKRIVTTSLEVKGHFSHTSSLVNSISERKKKRIFIKPGLKLKFQDKVKVHWDLSFSK